MEKKIKEKVDSNYQLASIRIRTYENITTEERFNIFLYLEACNYGNGVWKDRGLNVKNISFSELDFIVNGVKIQDNFYVKKSDDDLDWTKEIPDHLKVLLENFRVGLYKQKNPLAKKIGVVLILLFLIVLLILLITVLKIQKIL